MSLNLRRAIVSTSLISTFFFSSGMIHARTDDLQTLQERVTRIENTYQKNNQDVANAMNMLSEMKLELQSLKGQLESAQYLRNQSDRVYQDLDTRVSSLEDKIQQMHTLVKDLRPNAFETGSAAAPQTQEYEEFQSALNLINAQDYRAAASSLLGFMKKYPQSSNLGSAQYWLADSYYAMGDDAKSITEFQTLYEKYPSHPRVKEGIYKQGLSFLRLKKNDEAKLFFQKVISMDPNSAEALQAKGKLARMEESQNGPENKSDANNNKDNSTAKEPYYRPIMKPSPMPGAKKPLTQQNIKRTSK